MKITQALDIFNADATSNITEIEELPEIKILFRIVYKVKWGGGESAKKIVIWKTNKDEIDNTYPKYVFYYGDYSYLKPKPLKQSVYPFNSLEKVIAHLNFI